MPAGPPPGDLGEVPIRTTPLTAKQVTDMYQLTQLANDVYRERLAHAEQQRPAERVIALRRATRRAERAGQRMRRAERQVRRLRALSGA
jgi:hypothetical protein